MSGRSDQIADDGTTAAARIRTSLAVMSRRWQTIVRLALPIAVGATVLVGCGTGHEDRALAGKLESIVTSASADESIDLAELFPGSWTRLIVFPAYTPNVVARETLGFDFDIEATPSQSQDGDNLVVLATETAVTAWCVVGKGQANFGVESQPLVFNRADAVFRIGVDTFGDPALVPVTPSVSP